MFSNLAEKRRFRTFQVSASSVSDDRVRANCDLTSLQKLSLALLAVAWAHHKAVWRPEGPHSIITL